MSFYLAPIFTLPFGENFALSQTVQEDVSAEKLLSVRWVKRWQTEDDANSSRYSWLSGDDFASIDAIAVLPLDQGFSLSTGVRTSTLALLPNRYKLALADELFEQALVSDEITDEVTLATADAAMQSQALPLPQLYPAIATAESLPPTASFAKSLATQLAGQPIGKVAEQTSIPQIEFTKFEIVQSSPLQTTATVPNSWLSDGTFADVATTLLPLEQSLDRGLFQVDLSQALEGNIAAESPLVDFPDAVITQSDNGSWALNYPVQNAQRAQSVIAELAQRAIESREDCAESICRGLGYIESQRPKMQQEILNLQARIATFEQVQAEGDVAVYQQVLADRQAEITQQKSSLMVKIHSTEQQAIALKQQLVEMGAAGDEVDFAEQLLAQSDRYQIAKDRLQQAEQNLAIAFGSASADTTALYETYDSYELYQAELYRLASAVVNSYLEQDGAEIPYFIWAMPAALEIVQQLAIVASEQQMEQMRLGAIAQIEDRLSGKRHQLASEIGAYEQWQSQLVAAQRVLDNYKQEQSQLVARAALAEASTAQVSSSNPDSAVLPQPPNSVFERARKLVPYLPEGSTAQAVLYMVLASAAVAKITARRRAPQHVTIPQLAVAEFKPVAAIEAYGQQLVDTLLPQPGLIAVPVASTVGAMPIHTFSARSSVPASVPSSSASWKPTKVSALLEASETMTGSREGTSASDSMLFAPTLLDAVSLGEAAFSEHGPNNLEIELETLLAEATSDRTQTSPQQSSEDKPLGNNHRGENFEERILAELIELTGQSTRIVGSRSEAVSAIASADTEDIKIELMTRELKDIVEKATPESSLDSEIKKRAIAPVEVPLAEVDVLVERAIDWVIKDLGLSPMAAKLDAAEAAVKAEAAEATGTEEKKEVRSLRLQSAARTV